SMTQTTVPAGAQTAASTPKPRRLWKRVARWLGLVVGVLLILFVVNGTILSHGETPVLHVISDPPTGPLEARPLLTVKILAFNIAKCFVFKDGKGIESTRAVAARLERIAELIRAENPDFVFLSETVVECGPCPVNQVSSLTKATGMHAWAFGENYNCG